MRALLFLFVLFVSTFGHSQESLKSKYFGTYSGKINAYKMETAGELMTVSETPIKIEIRDQQLFMTIGKTSYKGTYKLLFETSDYFLIEAKMEGQEIAERVMVYKKGKKISRDGLYPQPNAILFKD
ncbi:MAG: hypothetical protein N4A41_08155 [Crocinitomicaceae bacterium]|jgi:hypothetical protein|nr:hypothetical protein [Crocinitomicaceae bacterium]